MGIRNLQTKCAINGCTNEPSVNLPYAYVCEAHDSRDQSTSKLKGNGKTLSQITKEQTEKGVKEKSLCLK